MIPRRERSRNTFMVSEEQAEEIRERKVILTKAKAGSEEHLAWLRDELKLWTWVSEGVTLIAGGVLVGAKR